MAKAAKKPIRAIEPSSLKFPSYILESSGRECL